MNENQYAVVCTLHKDNSPVVIECSSEGQQNIILKDLHEKGYIKAYKCSIENADMLLNNYGKQFEPKPLSIEEKWWKWALGK